MSRAEHIETPVVGYVAITIALLAGMLTASAFGQTATVRRAENAPKRVRLAPVRRWILGVRAKATTAGYIVNSVERDTTAQRLGLKPGDRIIAVDGQQIGYVGGKLFSLTRTLESKGGNSGHVRLLVKNHHNHQLVSLSAKLTDPLHHLGH